MYTPVFPNYSIFVSFGSYLSILYCFSNVFMYFYFILLGPPTCPIEFTSFVSFKFSLYFYHYILYFTFTYLTGSSTSSSIICFPSFIFLFLSNSKYCSNNFSSRLHFSMSSSFRIFSRYYLFYCFPNCSSKIFWVFSYTNKSIWLYLYIYNPIF